MTCAQGLLRLLWGGARSWSATGLGSRIRSKADRDRDVNASAMIPISATK